MVNNTFVEQLSRNRVLIDDNDCLDCKTFNNFDECAEISLKYSGKNYGGIYIGITGLVGSLKVIYSDIELINISDNGEYFIPLTFVKGEPICVDGKCDKLNIKLYGCKFNCGKYVSLLPQNNLVVYGFKNKSLYEFNTSDDIVLGNISKINTLPNAIFIQTYIVDNVACVGELYVDGSLKFANSSDGFSSVMQVANGDIKDAIFIQDNINGLVNFVYLKNNKLFSKVCNEAAATFDEEKVLFKENVFARHLISTSSCCLNSKFFGIQYDNSISIYVVKNSNNVEKVFDGVGECLGIYEYLDEIVVYINRDNCVTMLRFEYDINNNGTNIIVSINSKILPNVDCVLEYNKLYIYTSINGACRMKGVNE